MSILEIEEDVKESSPHTEVKEIIVEDTKTNDPNRVSSWKFDIEIKLQRTLHFCFHLTHSVLNIISRMIIESNFSNLFLFINF
jgi:hypothetical protein